MSKEEEEVTFWGEDLSVMIRPESLADFIPLPEHDEITRLNALSRFFLYLGVMIGVHRKSFYFFLVVCFIPLISIYLYYYKKYYLFDEAYGFGEEQDGKSSAKENFQDVVQSEFREPTSSNPFMNYNYTDIKSGVAGKKPRSYKDKDVAKKVEATFESQSDVLYRDTDKLYADKQSRVHFYSVPGTFPEDNDGSFRNWIFKELERETCKEKHSNCKPLYRDLRQAKRTK